MLDLFLCYQRMGPRDGLTEMRKGEPFMIVGFTGTQAGMSPSQKLYVGDLLSKDYIAELHHGDCIGADENAHTIALTFHIPIIIHPPLNPQKRAHCTGAKYILAPRPYLERNHDIVDASDIVIGTPKEYNEVLRSGTWATLRYARKLGRKLFVVWHDGRVTNDW